MKRRTFLAGAAHGACGIGAAAAINAPGRLLAAAGGKGAKVDASSPASVLERLRAAGVTVSAVLASRDGSDTVELALQKPSGARKLLRAGSTFTLQAVAGDGRGGAADVLASVRAKGSLDVSCTLNVAFAAWSRDVYVTFPGACYAGNRFEARYIAGHPPLLSERADIGPHVPPIIADIPRLNVREGGSSLELAAADLAAPAAAFFLPAGRLGLVVLVDPTTALGHTGFHLAEPAGAARATLEIATPFDYAAREAGQLRAAEWARPRRAGVRTPLPAGQQLTFRVRLHAFECTSVGALFERLFAVRKELTGPTALAHELPFSAAFAAHEERVNRRWLEKSGFYALGSGQTPYSTWQTGWCGGLAGTLPLVSMGGATSRARALATTAFLLDGGQAPSGLFHGLSDGKAWLDDGFAVAPAHTAPGQAAPPHARRWHLLRRSADTLTYLVRQLAYLERRSTTDLAARTDPRWSEAARRCADAFAQIWEKHRQLGQFVDIETAEVVVGGSTSAALAPAGLARAAALLGEPRYLEVAKAAADHYYDRYVRVGLTCGGPGDALQTPDGESAAALLESFVTLFEATRERVWIDRARDAAHLTASWVISHDVTPADGGCAAAGDVRTAGAVMCDAQARRAAPGYVLLSGAALFRLYRATGDVSYLELLRDTVRNLSQYLGMTEPGRAATTSGGAGADCPRAMSVDWSGSTTLPASGMFDIIGLLAYSEVPGVYVRTDTSFVFAFDHVTARVREHGPEHLVVSISNPTLTDATVRVLSESAAEAKDPLPPDAVWSAQRAQVPAGGAVDVVIARGDRRG
jgi:hypothetical protein